MNMYIESTGCGRQTPHRFTGITGATAGSDGDDPHAEKVIRAGTPAADPYLDLLRNTVRYVRMKYMAEKPACYLFTSTGCMGSCSYCAARFARGPVKSMPIDLIVKEFNREIEAGHRNFIILGDDVGAYGVEWGGSFPDLLSKLLAEVDRKRSGTAANARNTIRLYIDEFHPRWVIAYRRELTELIAHRSIVTMLCPLQSGSDRVLQLMKRTHDILSIFDSLRAFLDRNPRLRLDTKMMVGFPSETDEEFEESLERFGSLPLHSVIIAPYEEKENTPACAIVPKVPAEVISERIGRAQKQFRQRGIRTTLMSHE